MSRSDQQANQYVYIVEQGKKNFSAYVPDLPGVVATGSDRNTLHQRIREALCLHILGMVEDGEAVPQPTLVEQLDFSKLEASDEIAFAEPEYPDPVSAALDNLLQAAKTKAVEAARRMEVPKSVVSRLTSPVYHGHSMDSVRRFANALGFEVKISFKKVM